MLFEKNGKILFMGDSIADYERKRPAGEGLFNACRFLFPCGGRPAGSCQRLS